MWCNANCQNTVLEPTATLRAHPIHLTNTQQPLFRYYETKTKKLTTPLDDTLTTTVAGTLEAIRIITVDLAILVSPGTPNSITYHDETVSTASNSFYLSSTTSTGSVQAANVPTITGVSPSSGPDLGGTAITITGTNFTGVTKVELGTTTCSATYTVVSTTTITCKTPVHATGAVPVKVFTVNGVAQDTSAFTYIGPSITSITPVKGTTAREHAGADHQGPASPQLTGPIWGPLPQPSSRNLPRSSR